MTATQWRLTRDGGDCRCTLPYGPSPFVDMIEVRRSVSGGAVFATRDRQRAVRSDGAVTILRRCVKTEVATTAMVLEVKVRRSSSGCSIFRLMAKPVVPRPLMEVRHPVGWWRSPADSRSRLLQEHGALRADVARWNDRSLSLSEWGRSFDDSRSATGGQV